MKSMPSCMPSLRARDGAPAVGIDRKRKLLGRDIVLRRVVEEVVARLIGVAVRQRQVPAREHAGAGIDVGLLEVADADREELHQLAREVLLRPRPHVRAAVEPHEHRRILRDFDREDRESCPSAY